VTANTTYVALFERTTYTISYVDQNGEKLTDSALTTVVDYTEALTIPSVLTGKLVTGVTYTVDGVNQATKQTDGSYQILSSAINSDITVTVSTMTAKWRIIKWYDYLGSMGKDVAILETEQLASGGYTLGTYGDMIYSSKYDGYAMLVEAGTTEAQLTAMLSVSSTDAASVHYDGNVDEDTFSNGAIRVNSGDAGVLYSITSKTATFNVTVMMCLESDVNGDGTVDGTDSQLIERAYLTGKTVVELQAASAAAE
jgi:hypothetical protein